MKEIVEVVRDRHRLIGLAFTAPLWIVLTVATYWLFFDDAPYLTYLEPPYIVDRNGEPVESYQPGDTLRIKQTVKKLRNCEVTWQHFIVDGIVYSFPENVGGFSPVGKSTSILTFRIPTTIFSGDYIFRQFAEVKCNPLKTVIFDAPDVPFTVVWRD